MIKDKSGILLTCASSLHIYRPKNKLEEISLGFSTEGLFSLTGQEWTLNLEVSHQMHSFAYNLCRRRKFTKCINLHLKELTKIWHTIALLCNLASSALHHKTSLSQKPSTVLRSEKDWCCITVWLYSRQSLCGVEKSPEDAMSLKNALNANHFAKPFTVSGSAQLFCCRHR